jgi:hypothetical protein
MKTDRWRRIESAKDKLTELSIDASDHDIIAAVSDYLLAHDCRSGWHLTILDLCDGDDIEYDWKRKNKYGITTKDYDRARAWINHCMCVGYAVFVSTRKTGVGWGTGTLEQTRDRYTSL